MLVGVAQEWEQTCQVRERFRAHNKLFYSVDAVEGAIDLPKVSVKEAAHHSEVLEPLLRAMVAARRGESVPLFSVPAASLQLLGSMISFPVPGSAYGCFYQSRCVPALGCMWLVDRPFTCKLDPVKASQVLRHDGCRPGCLPGTCSSRGVASKEDVQLREAQGSPEPPHQERGVPGADEHFAAGCPCFASRVLNQHV